MQRLHQRLKDAEQAAAQATEFRREKERVEFEAEESRRVAREETERLQMEMRRLQESSQHPSPPSTPRRSRSRDRSSRAGSSRRSTPPTRSPMDQDRGHPFYKRKPSASPPGSPPTKKKAFEPIFDEDGKILKTPEYSGMNYKGVNILSLIDRKLMEKVARRECVNIAELAPNNFGKGYGFMDPQEDVKLNWVQDSEGNFKVKTENKKFKTFRNKSHFVQSMLLYMAAYLQRYPEETIALISHFYWLETETASRYNVDGVAHLFHNCMRENFRHRLNWSEFSHNFEQHRRRLDLNQAFAINYNKTSGHNQYGNTARGRGHAGRGSHRGSRRGGGSSRGRGAAPANTTASAAPKKKEACRKWNSGSCEYAGCRYGHWCSGCGSADHTAKDCPKAPKA